MSGIAVVFPGQGSQHSGMGQALAATFPEAREVFREADEALGQSISELCFRGSEQDLALTENTQPAILAVSVATLRVLEARGLRAQAAAGHSLGEYSAHVAAGTLEFADALRTVRLRGRFMQQAVPPGEGAMAAVLGLDAARVQQICEQAAEGQVVTPANLNSPVQVVIAGHLAAVERAQQLAREAGARRVLPLPVSAPFHCPLMQPARDCLAPVLDRLAFHEPSFPVYANVDATAVREADAARRRLLEQVTAPVRWQSVVEQMHDDGLQTMIEIGPGTVLSGLIRRIRKEVEVFDVSDPAGVSRLLEALGART